VHKRTLPSVKFRRKRTKLLSLSDITKFRKSNEFQLSKEKVPLVGESLRRMKMKLADMLVHDPKSTNVIDIVGNGRLMTRIRLESREHFPYCGGWTPKSL
jgi:hypothetical protein